MASKTEPFDVGDQVTFFVDFTNAAGTAANPSTVTLKVENPDGTQTTYAQGSLSNPSTGRWEKAVTVDKPGRWWFRFEGTGSIQLAQEDYVQVRDSRFA